MKNAVFVIPFFLNIMVNAQISIDQSDMPDVDDTIRISRCYYSASDYLVGGANVTWDFSDFVALSQDVYTFRSVWSTPLVYNIVFLYPFVSTIALKQEDFSSIPTLQFTDVYDFFKESSSSFDMVGYGAEINGIPTAVKYDNADILYKFPLSYGNIDSSFSGFEMSIPGLGYFGEEKRRLNTVDGWGTLITPYGSFQTIRIRSEISGTDSIYMDSIGIGFSIPREFTEYKWLGKGFAAPLLTVTLDLGLFPVYNYLDSVRTIIPGIEQTGNNTFQASVGPNPSDGILKIRIRGNYQGPLTIELFNTSGKGMLHENTFLDGSYKEVALDLSSPGFREGLYLLSLTSDKQTRTYKIVILK